MNRHFWVLLHRWAGLALTFFLVIVGLTGSLLAFLPEFARLTEPQLFAPMHAGMRLDAATLAERAEALVPQAQVVGVYLAEPDRALITMIPRTDPATGQAYPIGFDQIFLDPVTGAELAAAPGVICRRAGSKPYALPPQSVLQPGARQRRRLDPRHRGAGVDAGLFHRVLSDFAAVV